MQDAYYNYWGKAEKDGPGCHRLVYHCLDVAAVFRALLEADTLLRGRVGRLSPLPYEDTVALLTFLVALHDAGKFALPFQNRRPDVAARLGVPAYENECPTHHTEHGWWLYKKHLFSALAAAPDVPVRKGHRRALAPLVSAVMGHHGTPVDDSLKGAPAHFQKAREHAEAFACDLSRLFLPASLDIPTDEEAFRPLSWLFAGMCVVSDWIGSNTDWFPLQEGSIPLADYWQAALGHARKAVADCGLLAPSPANVRDFHALLPHLPPDASPSPLQRYALNDAIRTNGPQLHILEDLTGGGKTEAALLAAHGLVLQGDASGVYVALPTMATANAMYSRLADSYRALFEDSADRPSLMLAHGARHINQQFLSSIPLEQVRPAPTGEKDEPFCAAWLADNRKKALLAPCGAGTLDQALLGVLPARHQSLRLLGLGRSVLIADEVHAFDAYTTRLLCSLLAFHAALGGSAILLSATMPQELRSKLAYAFAIGAGYDTPELASDAFPLATRLDAHGASETPVASTRSVSAAVKLTDNEADAYTRLLSVHRAGGCGCWIRNTVEQARQAYDSLIREHGVPPADVILFHARFALTDRRRIEAEALRLFGKESTREERAGKILIATQVVEQSLDLDMDFLVTDLAPMELMLQRLGREHRHARGWRPEGFTEPLMLVVSPDPLPDAPADWYERVLGKAKYVYPRPALLWRTARLLKDAGRIDLCPDELGRIPEARRLVEGAYGEMEAPPLLEETDDAVLGEIMAATALADSNALPREQGYTHADAWHEDTVTPTRLGEETVQVRLVKCEDGALSLWAGSGTDALTCALSEVRVPLRKIADAVADRDLSARLDELREAMPDKGKWCRLMPLHKGAETWGCDMTEGKGRLCYHPEFGLEIGE